MLDQVVAAQQSLRELEMQIGVLREILVDRLKLALDLLADSYGSGVRRRAG